MSDQHALTDALAALGYDWNRVLAEGNAQATVTLQRQLDAIRAGHDVDPEATVYDFIGHNCNFDSGASVASH